MINTCGIMVIHLSRVESRPAKKMKLVFIACLCAPVPFTRASRPQCMKMDQRKIKAEYIIIP